MKQPQLTRAQIRFLLVKFLHFLAVMVIVAVLFFYFYQPPAVPSKADTEPLSVVEADISAYEQFCRNNKDIHCSDIEPEATQAAPQVILMDTGEIDENLKEQVSHVVANGCDLNLHPEDMNRLLDKLYEEELPEDIIDETPKTTAGKKSLHIVPARKPAYFGPQPVVVIVIDDMGISLKRTADIASLPGALTVSFLTYGKKLDEQVHNSRANGQEIMIHVPMEAKGNVDAAPDVLTTAMSSVQIRQNLRAMLAKFKDVKGVNNHMGSKLTEDKERMLTVMQELKEQGFFFLDSKTSPKSKAEEAAAEVGIAYAHRHVFLDNNNDKAYILGQLKKTEMLARKNGYAIAIGHPKTQTYAALKEWLPRLEQKGLQLVHLSRVIDVLHPRFEE